MFNVYIYSLFLVMTDPAKKKNPLFPSPFDQILHRKHRSVLSILFSGLSDPLVSLSRCLADPAFFSSIFDLLGNSALLLIRWAFST